MTPRAHWVLAVGFTSLLVASAGVMGCAQAGEGIDDGGSSLDGTAIDVASPNPTTCPPCLSDTDCQNGWICSQFGSDSYCAEPCPNGNECDSTHTCQAVTTASGDEESVCIPNGNACGATQQPPSNDAGPPPNTCPGLASPTTMASCSSCSQTSKTCQPNGCYGGWWCNTMSDKCQAAPTNCGGSSDGGTTTTLLDAGVTSSIGSDGGTESVLYFAIVGDTRPATEDDTSAYPSTIISKIFTDVNALGPMPPFLVSTGDYQYANPTGSQGAAQVALYLTARKSYSGVSFPAMGNHECTGYTTSNCGSGNADGITNNYTAFMTDMLGPISKSTPYYVINVASPTSTWTAKFVFVAANAWDSTQSTWFDSALSVSTTYTFIIRHESASANTAPGVTPSETIMAKHSYTMSIVGHTHTYDHTSTQEVLFGNGGAPLSSGDYGYGLVTQRTDGSLEVDAIDYSSGLPDTSFRFYINADGTLAP